MGDLEELYRTLYPPTMETLVLSRGEGFVEIQVYDQDGNRTNTRLLDRRELLDLAKEGI